MISRKKTATFSVEMKFENLSIVVNMVHIVILYATFLIQLKARVIFNIKSIRLVRKSATTVGLNYPKINIFTKLSEKKLVCLDLSQLEIISTFYSNSATT